MIRQVADRRSHLRLLLFAGIVALVGTATAAWKLRPQEQPVSLAARQPAAGSLTRMEETGRRLYEGVCIYCHGAEGDGFGLNAFNLSVSPRNFTDTALMASLSDERLLAVITSGGASQGKSPLMPAWGVRFTQREIAAIAAYVRTFSRRSPGNGAR